MLLYQSWNKSKLQLRNALIFFYLSICLISCLHSTPFSPSSFVLCGQVPQEEGQIADQCLQPACIWPGERMAQLGSVKLAVRKYLGDALFSLAQLRALETQVK